MEFFAGPEATDTNEFFAGPEAVMGTDEFFAGPKPHQHNTIPLGKGWFRKRTAWVCIECDEIFDVRPDARLPWEKQADLDREEAIQFERDVHGKCEYGSDDHCKTVGGCLAKRVGPACSPTRSSMDWDEAEVGWNEYGAWFGCKNIHVIAEEP